MMVTRMTPSEEKLPSCSVKDAGAVQVGKGRGGSFFTIRPTPLDLSHAANFLVKRAGGFGLPSV
jgi:hypothetical protein